MQAFVIVILAALVLLPAFNPAQSLILAAALVSLAAWCSRLQRRIADIESERVESDRILRVDPGLQADFAEPRERRRAPATSRAPASPAPVAPVPRPPFPSDSSPRHTATNTGSALPPPESTAPEPETYEPILQRGVTACRRWITTGNVPVKVGVIVSLFGLAFLIREAIDRSWLTLPIEMRLIGVAAFGVALLVLGWRLREQRAGYGLSLQGGGVATVYLTVYASFAIYGLLPELIAFALLVSTTLLAGTLALSQNTKTLAVLGIVGGFAAPILASDVGGSHVILFSYYAMLNAAIVAIAWQRAWRILNVLGFAFTFVIGSLWGYSAYQPAHFATTEPFLILFFLMYASIPVCFARLATPQVRGFVDGTLVFGVPLVAFCLQAMLLENIEHGLAWSAAALAAFYASAAAIVLRRAPRYLRVLGEAFAGLALAFIAITAPLALDAQATSLAWAVQGTAMCWLGWRQERRLALLAGIALQGFAAIVWNAQHHSGADLPAVINGPYLGAVVIALAGAVSSRIFDRIETAHGFERLAGAGLLLWASVWWLGAGAAEIVRVIPGDFAPGALMGFVAGTIAAAALMTRLSTWKLPAALGSLLAPLLVFGLLSNVAMHGHPFSHYGWIVWPAVLGVHWLYLRWCEKLMPTIAAFLHPIGYIVLVLVFAAEIHWYVGQSLSGIWPDAIVLTFLGVVLLTMARYAARVTWPIGTWPLAYRVRGAGVVAALGAAGALLLNAVSDGSAQGLPYIPIFNPVEGATIAFSIGLIAYVRSLRAFEPLRQTLDDAHPCFNRAAALSGLFLITMICARSVHHFAGVEFDFDRLMAAEIFQAAISIVWGFAGFSAMVVGTRRTHRTVWLAGAALMAVVVIKLFLLDLANSGTVERVISFLGVGVLLLVVGYFAPAPPRSDASTGTQEQS